MLRYLFFISLIVVLGCAKPNIMLERAIVLNATKSKITDVRIYHLPTRKTAEVNVILPHRSLELGFSRAPLLAQQAIVSWRDSAGVKREVTLNLPYDHAVAKEGRIMDLIYTIDAYGTVTAHLEKAK